MSNGKNTKTVSKRSMINYYEHKGYSFKEAEDIVNLMLDFMRENLTKGNSVQLHRIGTINPIIKKAGKEELFGKEIETGDRIKLKIETSRTLHSDYEKRLLKEKDSDILGLLD